MKLFHISQDENCDYDTYDSAVVAAETEEEARRIIPHKNGWVISQMDWCSSPDLVKVRLIGEAVDGIEKGTICASFNAG